LKGKTKGRGRDRKIKGRKRAKRTSRERRPKAHRGIHTGVVSYMVHSDTRHKGEETVRAERQQKRKKHPEVHINHKKA
jgi:hypothetical protein